jgi:molybdopterin converting factor small subunit
MQMDVTVKVYGELYRYVPGGKDQAVVTVPPGSTLQDLLQFLAIPDYEIWTMLVNRRRAKGATALGEGDIVEIFAPVAGG